MTFRRNPARDDTARRFSDAQAQVEELRSAPEARAWRAHQDNPIVQYMEVRLAGTFLALGREWRRDRKYATPDHWLLVNGRPFETAPLPRGYRRGEPQMCYANTLKAVLRRPGRLAYVEGFCSTGLLPFMHAWGLDELDRVVELTLPSRGALSAQLYWGVAFASDFVVETGDRRDCYGVIDAWNLGFPLLQDDRILRRALLDPPEGT